MDGDRHLVPEMKSLIKVIKCKIERAQIGVHKKTLLFKTLAGEYLHLETYLLQITSKALQVGIAKKTRTSQAGEQPMLLSRTMGHNRSQVNKAGTMNMSHKRITLAGDNQHKPNQIALNHHIKTPPGMFSKM